MWHLLSSKGIWQGVDMGSGIYNMVNKSSGLFVRNATRYRMTSTASRWLKLLLEPGDNKIGSDSICNGDTRPIYKSARIRPVTSIQNIVFF